MTPRIGTLAGIDVVVHYDQPRLQLPDELLPGRVPWPPGFKADMDRWLLSFFGTCNRLQDGEVWQLAPAAMAADVAGHGVAHMLGKLSPSLHMNERTWRDARAAVGLAGRP